MSDIKRVALNTLEPQKESEKVIKKLCRTIRISVILPESNEDQCPEYNYKDQLAAVKKKVKQSKDNNTATNGLENGLDPFGDNDDDVRRIALEMEAKYGSGVTGVAKKKRKGKKDDYADIGMGYDEGDSFIDNTDGYDEIIPQNVTTLHGGFYVNSGALEFKADDEASSEASSSSSSSSESSSSDSEGNEKLNKSKKRRRVLETSGESDSDTANAEKEKKPKLQTPAISMQHAIKKKLFSKNKIQVKKFRAMEQHKKTVKDLLRAKRLDLNLSIPDELKTVEDNIEKESSKENKIPMSISSVTDAIESVVKQVVVPTNYDKNQNKQSVDVTANITSIPQKVDSPESLSVESDSKTDSRKSSKEEEIKLPDNLPTDVATIVSNLKEAAINYKGEGKKAFFTKDVNTLLLNLEKKCKSVLSRSSRTKVYEHLSQYVNCTKDTLIRRAKLLELEDCEKRLETLKVKLKDSIDAVMPSLIANYEIESQKVLQKKFSKEAADNEEVKALKMPRRKFQWNEEAKKLVKDILGVKKRCISIEGKYKDKLEEQIVLFLRTVILPLWPEGWMYINNLTRVYNSMQDNSKSYSSTSSKPKEGAALPKPPIHSNVSITPVTNGKSSSEKNEISNSITVTKVHSEVLVNDSSAEKNHNSSTNKDTENSLQISEIPKHINKPTEVITQPSDLSTHTKKNDVFKPYISEPPSVSQIQKLLSAAENTQKHPKPNDMFKPYTDEIAQIDKNIPENQKVSNFNDKYLPRTEIVKQFPEKEKHSYNSYPDKDGMHSYTAKEKHNYTDKHSSRSDKHSSHSDKHSSRSDKHSSHSDKHNSHSDKHSSHSDKHSSHSDKHSSHSDKHSSHSDKHGSHSDKHSSHSDKHGSYSDKHRGHSEKEKHKQHNSYSSEKKTEEGSYRNAEKSSSRTENFPNAEKSSDLSKENSSDLSKFQMFKPYSETPKSHYEETSRIKTKDDLGKPRPLEMVKPIKTYSRGDYATSAKPAASSSVPEDCGVIVKNLQQANEMVNKDDKKDVNPVISKAAHCQGVNMTDRKLFESYKRTPNELNAGSYYPVAISKHSEYMTSTPMVSKADGDGQKDIQMVMENLKALQKLSCSPVKNNDNSSSSPVSVIAYNKSFSPSKTSGSGGGGSSSNRNDANNKGDLSGGFQDEFQKQFINSLQQLAASSSSNKSSYKNGS